MSQPDQVQPFVTQSKHAASMMTIQNGSIPSSLERTSLTGGRDDFNSLVEMRRNCSSSARFRKNNIWPHMHTDKSRCFHSRSFVAKSFSQILTVAAQKRLVDFEALTEPRTSAAKSIETVSVPSIPRAGRTWPRQSGHSSAPGSVEWHPARPSMRRVSETAS
jgi:hypothetical protein